MIPLEVYFLGNQLGGILLKKKCIDFLDHEPSCHSIPFAKSFAWGHCTNGIGFSGEWKLPFAMTRPYGLTTVKVPRSALSPDELQVQWGN